jgi:hypothetical protein
MNAFLLGRGVGVIKDLPVVIVILGFVVVSRSYGFDQSIARHDRHVHGDTLEVFLGDTVLVACTRADNALEHFTVVNRAAEDTSTVSIRFAMEDFGGERATLLTIRHTFKGTLTYKAKIRSRIGAPYIETTVVPLHPNIPSTEMWHGRVESIVLYEFRFSGE